MVFKVFSCDDQAVEGESYLRDDYGISCKTDKHSYFSIYAGIMIVVSPGEEPTAESPARGNHPQQHLLRRRCHSKRCDDELLLLPAAVSGKLFFLFFLLSPEGTRTRRRRAAAARSDTAQIQSNAKEVTRRGRLPRTCPRTHNVDVCTERGFSSGVPVAAGRLLQVRCCCPTINISGHSESGARAR